MRKREVKTDDRPGKTKAASCFHGLQLFAVQSSACVLVLAVVLLLRAIGGNAIEDVSVRFRDAMLHHDLLAVSAAAVTAPQKSETSENADVVFAAPLKGGVITSYFGNREDPFDASAITDHQGVDIAAAEGTALSAMQGGEVIVVGYEENGYGHYIVVQCDERHRYLYAHCSSIVKSKGDTVSVGDTIAYVGSTGRATGSHVHIEWFENDARLDPLSVLPEETYA